MSRRVVGAATGPREGWITVACDDGAVFVGLGCGDTYPLEVERGTWKEAPPIPGSQRAHELTVLGDIR